MGNNAATGHVVAGLNLHKAVGIFTTLEKMMEQNNIQPWACKPMAHSFLQRQEELAQQSPFRFVRVGVGLKHYGDNCGGWLAPLTRERFVQLSVAFFENQQGMKPSIQDQRMFYDVFDSIDLDQNATLSVGELAGGFSAFFGGDLQARVMAVWELLGTQAGSHHVDKGTMKEFIKPFCWAMIPPQAECMRPVLIDYVAEEVFAEMTHNSVLSKEELDQWIRRGAPSQAHLLAQGQSMHTVLTNAIVDRAADMIEGAVTHAYQEFCNKRELAQYGQKTWMDQNAGHAQKVYDVGMYRYATGSTRETPMMPGAKGMQLPDDFTRKKSIVYQGQTQPGVWDTMSTALQPHMNTVYQSTQSAFQQGAAYFNPADPRSQAPSMASPCGGGSSPGSYMMAQDSGSPTNRARPGSVSFAGNTGGQPPFPQAGIAPPPPPPPQYQQQPQSLQQMPAQAAGLMRPQGLQAPAYQQPGAPPAYQQPGAAPPPAYQQPAQYQQPMQAPPSYRQPTTQVPAPYAQAAPAYGQPQSPRPPMQGAYAPQQPAYGGYAQPMMQQRGLTQHR